MHSTAEPAERSQLSSWTLRQSCKVGSTSPAYRKGGRGSGAGGGGVSAPSVTQLLSDKAAARSEHFCTGQFGNTSE